MSLIDYQYSISEELLAVSKRVRNLVTHWGEDGKHHEAVLKNVIMKYLPENLNIGSGFVIRPTDVRGENIHSKQIDLIIYDKSYPTFFKEGDFVIITPDAVRGIIQVKANLENQNKSKTYNDSNENGKFIFDGKENKQEKIFNGIFSFDGYTERVNPNLNQLQRNIRESYNLHLNISHNENPAVHLFDSKYAINHISVNKDIFIKHWTSEFNNGEKEYYSKYQIQNLSFSFFISNLINYVSLNNTVEYDKYLWFSSDKEQRRVQTF